MLNKQHKDFRYSDIFACANFIISDRVQYSEKTEKSAYPLNNTDLSYEG